MNRFRCTFAATLLSLLMVLCGSAQSVADSGLASEDTVFLEPEMVCIPSGRLLMGGNGYPRDTPRRVRWVDGYCIAKFETTEREFLCYRNFLQESPDSGAHVVHYVEEWYEKYRHSQPDWPASGIRWQAAQAYAEWLSDMSGKTYRLPTETEWEFAAGGPERGPWPWGKEYNRENFNGFGTSGTDTFDLLSPVGYFPSGNTSLGISDMSGNVREWCSHAATTFIEKGDDPIANLSLRVMRGGFAIGKAIPLDQTVRHREIHSTTANSDMNGFRLAMDVVEGSNPSPSTADSTTADFLTLQERTKEILSTIPVGSDSRPWVLLHNLVAFGYKHPIPDADNKDRMFLPIDSITYRHTFETPKDADRKLILIDENGIKAQQGKTKCFLEDHKGQSVFVFSQIELPEFYTLSTGPRGAFSVYDLLSSTTYETHGFEDLSWILPAVAYYRGEWSYFTNRFGEKLYVNNLVKRFMEAFNKRTDRPCHAAHYHYCLAYLRWYDRYVPIIDDEARAAIDIELDKYYKIDLAAAKEDLEKLPKEPSEADDKTLFTTVFSVGHRLEWTSLWTKHREYDRSELYPLFESFTNLIEQASGRLKRADQEPLIYGAMCHGVHGFELLLR